MLLCFSSRGCSPLPPTCGPVRCAASHGMDGTVCLADLGSNHAHCRTNAAHPAHAAPHHASPSGLPLRRYLADRVLATLMTVYTFALGLVFWGAHSSPTQRAIAAASLGGLVPILLSQHSLRREQLADRTVVAVRRHVSACPPAHPIALGCSRLLGPPMPSRAALVSLSPRRGCLLLPTPGAAASALSWLGTSRGMSRSRPSQRSGSGTHAAAGLTTPPLELQRCEVERHAQRGEGTRVVQTVASCVVWV